VSSFTLTKPATWKPDAAAASKRFATLQQAAPKAAVQASISAVALESPAQPDFEGLKQLLHEDLLVAAASSPPVLEKFAGANSYLAKVVASLAAGEAPAPVRRCTWWMDVQGAGLLSQPHDCRATCCSLLWNGCSSR
jgi:hypothetical protein